MDLRAVLVDDEQLARDELRYLLGQVGGIDVLGQAGNGTEALAVIARLAPDLVLLDVQMPGLTGFEVARRMLDGGPGAHIIFVTAFDQHAIEAFEVNAVDYLLKPVEPDRLAVAVQRAKRRVSADRIAGDGTQHGSGGAAGPGGKEDQVPDLTNDRLEQIIQLVAERQSRRERLAIRVGERYVLVLAEEIIFASLIDDIITVVTGQHTGTSSYRTLDELHARLDPSVFWRVHRSHLVNINK